MSGRPAGENTPGATRHENPARYSPPGGVFRVGSRVPDAAQREAVRRRAGTHVAAIPIAHGPRNSSATLHVAQHPGNANLNPVSWKNLPPRASTRGFH